MPDRKAFFLITIDTEGDNLWDLPEKITTANSSHLERFQKLCEEYGFRPCYLVSYEMAICPVFQKFAKTLLQNNTGEIGMHLHAWNTPPLEPITDNDFHHQPYLIEYPEQIMQEKIHHLTNLLEKTFEKKMTSHRSGRWGFNETYARIIHEEEYNVDCSVTPHVSWKKYMGAPGQNGGSDFRDFPEEPYYLNLEDISRPGDSNLLEVPVTIQLPPPFVDALFGLFPEHSIGWKILNRIFTHERWLRPNGRNLHQMLRILENARRRGCICVEFMLHSSELMPGGSPTFPTREDIENLYSQLQSLFSEAAKHFQGATLKEFQREYSRRSQNGVVS